MGTGAFLAHGHFGSSDAKFYGVELDSITGRISKQLYQKASIQVTGYENALLPDNYFDCVIGNVPFGNFQVNDPQYNRLHFPIHDYFFAKSIDKLRTGGIMAIITSSGTLDKKDDRARKYIAERCDLIGAVRLPNNAFKGSGTKIMTDAAAAMFPALITFCYDAADMNGKRFFWEYILESNSLVFEDAE